MRVAIFSKKSLIRAGFRFIIAENFYTQYFIGLDDAYELTKFRHFDADLLIIDYEKESKEVLAFLSKIISQGAKLKVLVYWDIDDNEEIFKLVRLGIKGFVDAKAGQDEIVEAIKKVLDGQEYYSDSISTIILNSYVKTLDYDNGISQKKPRNLTRREIQILNLVTEGLTNKQIADGLNISIRTVNAHKNHIMQKLGLKTTAELIKFAIKNNLINV